MELAFETLERPQWPRTEAEIHLLRSSMFAAQAIFRYMIKAGLEDDVAETSRDISEIAPELPSAEPDDPADRSLCTPMMSLAHVYD
ncbi:MAG: hypothetical protein F4053_11610 [Proteobacteria bacterium]|nr:hypothetical protein [Pseudomonadota bacterium]MYJ96194.1 hypothetical protein [Pseudomonadota bacterium]